MLEEIKRKFKERDRAISVLSKNGIFRVVAIRNTTTAGVAQANHNLSESSTYYLAQALTAATMLSVFLKGEERVILEIKSDGILSKIYAEVMHIGECRGYIRLAEGDFTSDYIKSHSDIFSTGTLQVARILYDNIEPIVGIIPLRGSDIAYNMFCYFAQSEQIPTSLVLDTRFDSEGNITCSGGLMIQAMPGAGQAEIDKVAEMFDSLRGKLCELITDSESLENMLHDILPFDFAILKNKQIDFYCRCSIENYKSRLLMLTIEELKSMKALGQNELVCQFCNKKYYLSDADFDMMIEQKLAEMN